MKRESDDELLTKKFRQTYTQADGQTFKFQNKNRKQFRSINNRITGILKICIIYFNFLTLYIFAMPKTKLLKFSTCSRTFNLVCNVGHFSKAKRILIAEFRRLRMHLFHSEKYYLKSVCFSFFQYFFQSYHRETIVCILLSALAISHFRIALERLLVWLIGFLTSLSTTRLYRGRALRQSV